MSSASGSNSRSVSVLPKYCRKRCKGRADRAFVKIDGKQIMLGVYGSDESREKYAELVGANQQKKTELEVSAMPTVAEVLVAYLTQARRYYAQSDGSPGREYEQICDVAKHVRKIASSLPATDFGPRKLKEVRQSLIDDGLSRIFINKQIGRVVRVFKWASSEELVPVTVHMALATVEGLKRGRSDAKETEPIPPVDDAIVDATVEHLPEIVVDMVRLQRLSGVRPGEVVRMRPCDLDRSGHVWSYKPPSHKTGYLGKSRTIALGPRAQEILLRYLARDPEMHCFRPCDSEQRRRARAHADRKTSEKYGNRPGTNRVEQPKRSAGEVYTVDSYRRAVHRACDKAFPHPELSNVKRADLTEDQAEELKRWQSSRRWSPNQLRHTAATEIRRDFGLEHAQVVLGHSNANVTQVYAERDFKKAEEVAAKIG